MFPPPSAFLMLMGSWHCRPHRALGWACPMQSLCTNVVVFDANRAITAAGHGGRGLQVTVPSWPCTARASTMSGEHEPRDVWSGWGSASPVVCAALMLSGVGAPRWGDIQTGARQCLASPALAREEHGFWHQRGLCQAALKATVLVPRVLSVLCNVLSSTSMAECWGLQAGDHWQTRHQGLTRFLQGLLKLAVPCRQGGLRAHLLFSSLSIACEQ